MDGEKQDNSEKNENKTKDVSEVLEWERHYATRKKAWRLEEIDNDTMLE